MAWSNSKVFQQFLANTLTQTAVFDLDTHTFKVALYDNDITPDQNAAAASTAYNVGQWVLTGNEVSQAGQWAAGGVALTTPVVSTATAGVVFWDAADTASGSAATLTNAFGCLVYDDTLTTPVADQGVCYNYFGGANSVTAGTFTVVWNANGIWRATL
jgi:hypothetical protein